MGNFRKILAILLLALTLCGCGAEEPEETIPIRHNRPGQTETQPSEPAPTDPEEVPADRVSVEEPDLEAWIPTLTEVGTVSEPEDVVFLRGLPVRRWEREEETGYHLMRFDLKEQIDGVWQDFRMFDNGIVAAYEYTAALPRCGLVDGNTGEILLMDNACKIEAITDRFFLVRYATGRTTDPEESYIRFSGSQFRPETGEEEILYRGYGRIFDLETGEFVPGLTLEGTQSVSVCAGRTICVKTGWDTADLYTPEGACLAEAVSVTVCGEYLVQTAEDGLAVYDAGYRYLRTVPGADVISESGAGVSAYSGKFLKTRHEDSGLLGVVDLGGHEMLAPAFDTISGAVGDYLIVGMEQEETWRYGLYLADGTPVLSCGYEGIYGDGSLPVIHYYDENDRDHLYIPGVGSVNLGGFSRSGMVYYRSPNGASDPVRSYLIYGTGRYLTCTEGRVLGELLIYSPEMGLVEAVGGTVLLTPEEAVFDRLEAAGDYLYGFREGTGEVTIYRVN